MDESALLTAEPRDDYVALRLLLPCAAPLPARLLALRC